MTSSKQWYCLHTHIAHYVIKKVEEDKMSDSSNREWSDEERIVAVVGVRARRLVEAVRRIERGRAGRTLPNLEETPKGQT